jgi:hypothetical protein
VCVLLVTPTNTLSKAALPRTTSENTISCLLLLVLTNASKPDNTPQASAAEPLLLPDLLRLLLLLKPWLNKLGRSHSGSTVTFKGLTAGNAPAGNPDSAAA